VIAFGIHLFGFAADHVGRGLENIYDIVIFLPLKIEEAIVGLRSRPVAALDAPKGEGRPSAV
jgi:hypothetical protein